MPSEIYTTKELSTRTWPDFVRLFSQGNGWDFCWCMHFQRPCAFPRELELKRAERSVRNRPEKQKLVESGQAHGILVYEQSGPVGWCQYGPRQELPRIDNTQNYRGQAPDGATKLWRITCFVVDKKHRRRGIAAIALQAALESIRRKGGGLVEGYPVANWQGQSFGNASTHGTVSMFREQGFEAVAPFGSRNVLMRKML